MFIVFKAMSTQNGKEAIFNHLEKQKIENTNKFGYKWSGITLSYGLFSKRNVRIFYLEISKYIQTLFEFSNKMNLNMNLLWRCLASVITFFKNTVNNPLTNHALHCVAILIRNCLIMASKVADEVAVPVLQCQAIFLPAILIMKKKKWWWRCQMIITYNCVVQYSTNIDISKNACMLVLISRQFLYRNSTLESK